jgi:hypothetical protein
MYVYYHAQKSLIGAGHCGLRFTQYIVIPSEVSNSTTSTGNYRHAKLNNCATVLSHLIIRALVLLRYTGNTVRDLSPSAVSYLPRPSFSIASNPLWGPLFGIG